MKPSWFCTISAAGDLVVDRLVHRAAQAGGEDRHEDDQREPTISAAAVTAVRWGWRMAFSRASTPVSPRARQRRAEHARQRAHEQRREERDAEHHQHGAEPDSEAAAEPSRCRRTARRTARSGRAHERPRADDAALPAQCPRPGVTPSRIAVTGSTASRAGPDEPGDHRRDHADDEADDDRAWARSPIPVVPRSMPKRLEDRRQRRATTRPASTPTIDAISPTTNVSINTDWSTCAREAPSTRSNANSFVRWATVTVNVLKIRKPPTSSATPAKTSSAMRMNPRLRTGPRLLSAASFPYGRGSRLPSAFWIPP